jgi:hypothetical protein
MAPHDPHGHDNQPQERGYTPTTPVAGAPTTTSQNTSDITDQVQQKASAVADKAQEQAGQMKDQLVEQVTSRLDDRKSAATGSLGTVADSFRQTSQQLREQNQDVVADYADRAAEQIEHFTGYLRGRDVRQLVRDVEDFSRREPALFLGGAFALGLFAARFLKSSTPRPEQAPQYQYPREYQQALPASGSRAEVERYAGTPSASWPDTSTALGAGAVGSGAATDASANVIVGGPPITDAVVGGPPHEPGVTHGQTTTEARSSGDAGA